MSDENSVRDTSEATPVPVWAPYSPAGIPAHAAHGAVNCDCAFCVDRRLACLRRERAASAALQSGALDAIGILTADRDEWTAAGKPCPAAAPIHPKVAAALEEIDAAVFNGDTFDGQHEALWKYVDRWQERFGRASASPQSGPDDLRRGVRGIIESYASKRCSAREALGRIDDLVASTSGSGVQCIYGGGDGGDPQ